MPKRFTITEKWEDGWFWSLPPQQKLLWNYLCDKCDLAGFWEVNLELAAVQTKIPKRAISGAVQGLNRGYVSNGKYIWLRTFIHHQGNYPLNPKNNCHRHILSILERHTDFDIDFSELLKTLKSGAEQGLISPIGKGNSKGNSKSNGKKEIEPIAAIFAKWQLYKGQGSWKSHKSLSYDIKIAITEQLKHYSVDDLCVAIDNYARILLNKDFKWSYAWHLRHFLTRKNRDTGEQQLWRFLSSNYQDDDYLTDIAKKRRIKQKREHKTNIEEATEDKLLDLYQKNGEFQLNWLIDKLRPEIKEILKGR